MTVAELLRRISSAELTEWVALFDLEHEEARSKGLAQAAQQGLQQRKRNSRNR